MRSLYLVLTSLALCWYYLAFQVEYSSSRAINAYLDYLAHEVFPWVIGCTGFVKIYLAIFYRFRRKLPRFPGLGTWLASIQIYIGAAVDVLVCFGSLLRINLSYLCLAIVLVPLMAIFFISLLCFRHNQLSGTDDGKNKMMTRKKNSKKSTENFNIAVLLNNGLKTRVMPEEFNIVVLLAPHIILSVSGVVGDPDHDGNNYDISNLFMFLTCVLQELTLIMISRGIAPVSELLYKASLVVLLLTAHILAVNAFGKKAVLLLLPEVVPPLLWFSLHLDRRTPIINIQNIKGSEHFVLMPLIVAILGYIMVVPKDESLLVRLCWGSMSCFTSGLITYIILLVLRLWPEKVGMATLSSEEVLKLLTFWGKVLLEATVGLLAFGGLVWLKSTVGPQLCFLDNTPPYCSTL